jgi:hypothetical protein
MEELEKSLSSLLIATDSISERFGKDSSIYASYLQTCGLVLSQLGKTEEAEKYLLQSAEIWGSANDSNIQTSLLVLAQFYLQFQKYDDTVARVPMRSWFGSCAVKEVQNR